MYMHVRMFADVCIRCFMYRVCMWFLLCMWSLSLLVEKLNNITLYSNISIFFFEEGKYNAWLCLVFASMCVSAGHESRSQAEIRIFTKHRIRRESECLFSTNVETEHKWHPVDGRVLRPTPQRGRYRLSLPCFIT